ncbi:hypothetical protein DMENIID0001_050430 [Sergentomyia squamirostris]
MLPRGKAPRTHYQPLLSLLLIEQNIFPNVHLAQISQSMSISARCTKCTWLSAKRGKEASSDGPGEPPTEQPQLRPAPPTGGSGGLK